MLPRYFLASVLALAIDYGIYLLILRFGGNVSPPLAAAPAYIAGAVVHYCVSRHFVFPQGWLHRHRLREFALFLSSGLLGALLTSGVVWAVSSIPGSGIHWPKIAAIGVSFVATYLIRKYLVFRAARVEES